MWYYSFDAEDPRRQESIDRYHALSDEAMEWADACGYPQLSYLIFCSLWKDATGVDIYGLECHYNPDNWI
jgi:hypothetical protein